jgi:PAS domain S-box-containing protein
LCLYWQKYSHRKQGGKLKKQAHKQEQAFNELEALRKSERLNRLILEHIQDLVAIHKLADLSYEYVNLATLEVLGYTEAELFSLSPLELVHPDDMDRVFTKMKANLPKGESQDEFRYRKKDGSYIWLKVTGAIMPHEADQASLIIISRDISDQKKSEAALLKAYYELGLKVQEEKNHFDQINALLPAQSIDQLPIVESPRSADNPYLTTAENGAYDNASSPVCINTENEGDLLSSVCQQIVELSGYSLAWVGYVQEDQQKVKPVACAGRNNGYLAKLNITLGDPQRGQGPAGTAVRTGQPVVSRNLKNDPAFKPWVKDALRRGFKSCMSIPLRENNQVFGVLNIYADEIDIFDRAQEKMLIQMANNLAGAVIARRAGS